jgi:hypothetical protein
MVKVHRTEGVANHSGPESCADAREGVGEALTGVRIGQPLSRERHIIPGADDVAASEGDADRREPSARTARPGAV